MDQKQLYVVTCNSSVTVTIVLSSNEAPPLSDDGTLSDVGQDSSSIVIKPVFAPIISKQPRNDML